MPPRPADYDVLAADEYDDPMHELLELISQLHPAGRSDVIAGLTRRLQLSTAKEAEMNGYIVFILNRMQAVEAGDVIVGAFEQEKVDTKIMTLEDVTFL